MQAPRLNDLLDRVVAWHNRHPLARRVQPHQVHSIGEVLLPFASAVPLQGAHAATPANTASLGPADTGTDSATLADAALAAGAAAAGTVPSIASADPWDDPVWPSDGADSSGAPAGHSAATDAPPPLTAEEQLAAAADSLLPSGMPSDPAAADGTAADAVPADGLAPAPEGAADLGPAAEPEPGPALPEPVPEPEPEPNADARQDSAVADQPQAAAADTPSPALTDADADADTDTDTIPAGDGKDASTGADLAAELPADPPADPAPDVAGAEEAAAPAGVQGDGPEAPSLPSATALATAPDRDTDAAPSQPLQAPAADGPAPGGDGLAHSAPAPPFSAAPISAAPIPATTATPGTALRAAPRGGGWMAGLRRKLGGAHTPGAEPPADLASPPEPPLGALRALFSEDFVWPLTPQRVARWARRHGRLQPLAPSDWPRRRVATDASLLASHRRDGHPHTVLLHVLTAGIGVGDRRLRVLVGADGAVLGPRSYSPKRMALAGGLLWLLLGGALALLWPKGAAPVPVGAGAAVAADAAGSAASAGRMALAASASQHAAEAASAASAASAPLPEGHAEPTADTDTDTEATAPTATTAPQPAHPAVAASAADRMGAAAAAGLAASAASGTVHASVPMHAGAAATAALPTSGPVFSAAPAPSPRVRPLLSDEEKAQARALSATARTQTREPLLPPPGGAGVVALPAPAAAMALPATPATAAAPAPPAPAAPAQPKPPTQAAPAAMAQAYAVVTAPSPQHDVSLANLAFMRAVRANVPSPAPGQMEVLVLPGGQWRAAWWPFDTPADAERARALLATRGVKTEVVPF